MKIPWIVPIALLVAAVPTMRASAMDNERLYNEQYRPQIHFSPAAHWMNDPNGMVFVDGEYHLFYQYHPSGTQWGPMHWGHATSKDMVHWSELPIALFPDEHGYIFSGSIVYDVQNTSGMGSRERPPMVALYTNHNAALADTGSITFENQSLAYSLDRGRSWSKHPSNPVLPNPGNRDFRDPKLVWFEASKKWIMTLAVKDHVSFYSSADLLHWVHESDFGTDLGAHGGVWECPDLFSIPVDGGSDRYVLMVSINRGGPNGGSGTQYFVGGFDGHEFTAESAASSGNRSDVSWLDYGTDDYAGVTWSGIPASDGRRLFLGWMNNWTYARQVPTKTWRGAMTLPRELKLVRAVAGFELRSTPVIELNLLRSTGRSLGKRAVSSTFDVVRSMPRGAAALELDLRIDTASASIITIEFANSVNEKTTFTVNRSLRRYELDRSHSGSVDFSPDFPMHQYAPMSDDGSSVSLRVYNDRSSIEIFVNDGQTVMTSLQFPSTPYTQVTLAADRTVTLDSGHVYGLKSIWNTR